MEREESTMVTYRYACADHGPVEVRLPMGSAPGTLACPGCGEPARRVFTGPMLSTPHREALKVIDATKATGDQPEVVTSLPTQGRRHRQPMAPPDPRLRKLPRP